MPSANITRAEIFEDGGCQCLARVVGNAGTAITQASLTAITAKVFDLDSTTPDTAVATPTVTISSAVFDTLQTDDRWDADDTGYNFKFEVAASAFSTGGRRYRIEFLFDPTSGENFWVVFEVTARNVRTS